MAAKRDPQLAYYHRAFEDSYFVSGGYFGGISA
jgi:hypothetical protein